MKQSSWEIIEHTADIGIRVRGQSKEELFENAAKGMLELLTGKPGQKLEGDIREQFVTVEGPDPESLLVAFLSEILYFYEGENFLPENFSEPGFTGNGFRVKIIGHTIQPEKKRISLSSFETPGIDIKAVTYHKMNISFRENYWETDVIFDV